ncbi:hypothetical protein LINGRAHAP2_LOCUS4866 [Linum grandiflorum]
MTELANTPDPAQASDGPSAILPPKSYASALSRDVVATAPVLTPKIQVKDNNISLSFKNHFRYLHTSRELRAKICVPLRKALVVCLIRQKVGIQYMYDWLKAMWRQQGRMRMVDLDNDVFLPSFDNTLSTITLLRVALG